MADLLTNEEHELVDMLGQCARLFCGVIVDGSSGELDSAEAASHIHALQNMVLAQAAARAYPTKYRLMGGHK